jgi:S-adenosylmethionine:tRNA ribosyltransferase-isomerase
MRKTDELLLSDFQYNLPDERIARYPLPQRDASKLLVYQNGSIRHEHFRSLPDFLPPASFLVFNNTKVIPARLHFTKSTGAVIELFLLNPFPNDLPLSLAMEYTGSAIWQGMIGNRKRWKPGEVLQAILPTARGEVLLSVTWYDYDKSIVQLNWQPADLMFAQLIQYAGEIPLPPYLKRDATDADKENYQTIYSTQEGAVAAPTAGLHFTPSVFEALDKRGIEYDYLTLHVGAGTFQPIKAIDVRQHEMHSEQVVYTQTNLRNLLNHLDTLVAVGTTSMRALESLYWIGAKLMHKEANPFHLDQRYAYQCPLDRQPSVRESITAVLDCLLAANKDSVVVSTGIYITPGYQFKLCKGIVTNFHQPGSTLILLIAALLGDDWKRAYTEALARNYRFLSYGDSSLLLP